MKITPKGRRRTKLVKTGKEEEKEKPRRKKQENKEKNLPISPLPKWKLRLKEEEIMNCRSRLEM